MNNRAEYEIKLKDAFTPGLKRATNEMNNFESKLGGIQSMAGKVGIALSFAAVGAGIKKISDLGAAAEQTKISFEVLAGSATKGNKLLGQLKEYANITPYVSSDVLQASKVMLGFGVSQEKILPTMKMLGDVASGDAERLKSLSLVYGQITAAGRLMGQDLLQLINNGFNPLQVMSSRSGKSMAELKKMMEDGAISAKDVAKAFKFATEEGGLFFNMTEKQSQTFAGKMSTVADKLEIIFTEIGKKINQHLVEPLDKVGIALASSFEETKNKTTEISKLKGYYQAYQDRAPNAEELLFKNFSGYFKQENGKLIPDDDLINSEIQNFSSSKKQGQLNIFDEIKSVKKKIKYYDEKLDTKFDKIGLSGEKIRNGKLVPELNKRDREIFIENRSELINNLTKLRKELNETSAIKDESLKFYLQAFGNKNKSKDKFDFELGTTTTGKANKGHGGVGQENERLGGTKNITINVSKLIGIETNQQMKDTDPRMIGEAVKRELLTALHDANLAIGN